MMKKMMKMLRVAQKKEEVCKNDYVQLTAAMEQLIKLQ